jgi:hypothetical protein
MAFFFALHQRRRPATFFHVIYCFHRVLEFSMTKFFLFAALGLSLSACQPNTEELQAQVDPLLSDIQFKVFAPSCALSGCHNSVSKKGNLILEDGVSLAEILNVTASNSRAASDGKLLVVPGDSANSFFFQKLFQPEAGEGGEMPLGSRVISDAAIEAIRLWIDAGALDN